MLQQEKHDDYVISIKSFHIVEDFVKEAFEYVRLD
jgi:GDP-D-mannose dehydratase